MSVGDEIQKAIDRLAALKEASTSGPWEEVNATDVFTSDPKDDHLIASFASGRSDISYTEEAANRFLVVVLHRTIDAQLAILEAAMFNIGESKFGHTHATVAAAIRLAQAINGGTK